jgi:hypothetical protein
LGFFLSQPIDFQSQASLQPLQKQSYLKSYRRFFVRSAMCHNRRMNVEMTDRCEVPGSACASRAVVGVPPNTPVLIFCFRTPTGKRRPRAGARNCNSAQPGSSWYKPVQVSTSEYNQKKLEQLQCKNTCHSRRQNKKWKRKNVLFPSFCL